MLLKTDMHLKAMTTVSVFFEKIVCCEQGSNLRWNIPLDFKSNALTTQPSQLYSFESDLECIFPRRKRDGGKTVLHIKAVTTDCGFPGVKITRQQGWNLRGNNPLDVNSNALIILPSQFVFEVVSKFNLLRRKSLGFRN